MATYFNDCSSVTGWSERIKTGRGWASSGGSIQIVAAGANDWNYLTLDEVEDSNHANVEILAKYTTPSSLSSSRYPLVVRGAGSDESATGYSIRVSTSAIRIYSCNASDTPVQVATAAFTFSVSTTYWIRFRANSTSLKARVWADGGGEPGTWDLDVTDSTISAAGWNGLSDYSTTVNGGTVDQIGFGTNGDTAPSSASSGYTLAADSGSYTLTGTAASLIVGRKLAADSGSYSLSGTAAAFKRGYALTADSGSYTLSGTTVSLTAGRKLAADSGSYTLTGTDVTLNYSPAGSYNLTAESGTYTLTGTAATLKVSRKLTADSGAYPLTGTDVTLSKGVKLTADSGSYTLTGSNVSLARTYVLTAESGSYALTGTSAGLTWSGAPVVEVPTNGGPSIYGKPVFREKQFRKEYEEQVKRIEDEKRLARILREDEEITVIMALMAA